MQFKVNIEFRNHTSFSTRIPANCKEVARSEALNVARRSGFNGRVKKYEVIKMEAAQ